MRAWEFFGGVAEVVVPDNLKSAVTHPSYYEPDLNPTYRDLGEHYGVAIIPARPYRPREKAYVSYCTLSCSCRDESRLFGPPASLALENGILIQGLV
jgi:transposase